jgi:hypothetical protein
VVAVNTGLARLRLAATLVHSVPGVRLRLRVDGQIVEVARAQCDGSSVPACRFREAVRRTYRSERDGFEIGDWQPDIDVLLTEGDLCAGGILRVPLGDGEAHVFATTLDTAACTELFGVRGDPAQVVHLFRDDALDVTLVHVESEPDQRDAAHALVEELLGACVAGELVGV